MKQLNKKGGFTLIEILTAVIIVAILTVMAMPLYEKAVERSRMTEARSIMNRLQAAKLAAMDNMGCSSYTYNATSADCPRLEHLGVAFVNDNGTPAAGQTFQTKDFKYSLGAASDTYRNGVCAKRLGGEYAGTVFAHYGLRQDGGDAIFKCKNPAGCSDCCENYGLDNTASLTCSSL